MQTGGTSVGEGEGGQPTVAYIRKRRREGEKIKQTRLIKSNSEVHRDLNIHRTMLVKYNNLIR